MSDVHGKEKEILFAAKNIKLRKMLTYLAAYVILAILFTILNENGVYIYSFSEGSKTSSIMFYLAFVCYCGIGYCITTVITYARIRSQKGSISEVSMLARLFKTLAFIAGILGIAFVLGKLTQFTAALSAFAGMMLGWSLQAPVSGIAAWIMVTIIRPYKIGDRIQLPNYALMGDIIKFSPMYLTLNQVGGTVGGEEASGRILHVPNATLFSAMIINTTYQQKQSSQSYILDEVVFRVTFDSDWDTVESIIIRAARTATADIIQATGVEPYIRAETWDYGTLFRVRYMTDATDRPKFMHQIVKLATKEFQTNKNVDLTIPYLYSFKRGATASAAKDSSQPEIKRIPISEIRGGELNLEETNRVYQQEIDSIAKSILKKGLLQPIAVTRALDGEGYIVQFGEKRLLACKQIGWDKVPCVVNNPYGTEISIPPVSRQNNTDFEDLPKHEDFGLDQSRDDTLADI